METFTHSLALLQCLGAAFFAILFLQSGLDKVFDWQGNLSWLKEHFAKSLLKGMVPLLLGVLTLMEVASGVISTVGVIWLLFSGKSEVAFWGVLLSAISLLMLFFGQRMAKDYAGAASLVPYFLCALFVLFLFLHQ
jgi:hypothetical protein